MSSRRIMVSPMHGLSERAVRSLEYRRICSRARSDARQEQHEKHKEVRVILIKLIADSTERLTHEAPLLCARYPRADDSRCAANAAMDPRSLVLSCDGPSRWIDGPDKAG